MQNISYYIAAMLPYMIVTVPITVIVRLFKTKNLNKKGFKFNIYHEIGLIIYITFIAGLFSQTILANIYSLQWKIQSKINLIPGMIFYDSFKLWHLGNTRYFVISLLGNIIMFMPFGFFTPLLWNKKNLKDSLLAGFLASLTVEICQLPQAGRTSDVDDLILNTLGAFLGYLLYKLMLKILPKFTTKFLIVITDKSMESQVRCEP